MSNLNTYILFPASNPTSPIICSNDKVVADAPELKLFLEALKSLLEMIGCEKDACLYYSSKEIIAFLEGIEEESKELYLIDPASTIDEYLQNANAVNWRENPLQKKAIQYFLLDFDSCQLIELFDHSMNEGLEKKLSDLKHRVLFINHHAIKIKTEFVTLIKKERKPVAVPIFKNLSISNNNSQLEKWTLQKRIKRIFNLNPKHGENGKSAHTFNKGDEVSLLECSKANAQTLLESAIGDVRIDSKRLFNYDLDKAKYIVFYFEGESPQNQYHGFHLTSEIAKQKIPNNILKRLKEKYQL